RAGPPVRAADLGRAAAHETGLFEDARLAAAGRAGHKEDRQGGASAPAANAARGEGGDRCPPLRAPRPRLPEGPAAPEGTPEEDRQQRPDRHRQQRQPEALVGLGKWWE